VTGLPTSVDGATTLVTLPPDEGEGHYVLS